MATQTPQKPLIIFAAPPAHGHTAHLLPHAAYLSSLDYPVYFLAGPQFQRAVSRTGASFVPTPNTWNDAVLSDSVRVPEGHTPFLWEQRRLFLDGAPECFRSLKGLLEDVGGREPGREVILVEEMLFMGSWPFLLGAELPRGYDTFPKVISFSSIPIWVSSLDTAPFAAGHPPDASPAGRERNRGLYEEMEAEHAALTSHANKVFASLGATREIKPERKDGIQRTMFDVWATAHPLLLVPCSPSLEYPRSDLPPNITFIGPAPRPALDLSTPLPPWWCDLAANTTKKVVLVTQGTVVSDFDNLVRPTLLGLRDREDVLVVAILGKKGAGLGFEAPANARVVDYLAYHAVLPFADVFVSNGGYGGFMQAVMYGVPMVLAGTTRKFPSTPFLFNSPPRVGVKRFRPVHIPLSS